MARHTTARGEPIDMGALIAQNANAPALGNAKMNARGDILGENGIVLKTQEQIEAEWAAERAKQKLLAGRPGNIKAPLETMVDPNAVPQQKNLTADKDFEPEVTANTGRTNMVSEENKAQTKITRRKIVDSE